MHGAETIIPAIGRDFIFPLSRAVELNGAFSRVERTGTSTNPFYPLPDPDQG